MVTGEQAVSNRTSEGKPTEEAGEDVEGEVYAAAAMSEGSANIETGREGPWHCNGCIR